MLNDLAFFSNDNAVKHGVLDSTRTFKKNTPYAMHKSGLHSGFYPIISSEFESKCHFAMDYGAVGTTVVMSPKERNTWFDFVDLEDGRTFFTEEEESVVQTLDEGFVAQVMEETYMNETMQNEDYLELMHSKNYLG